MLNLSEKQKEALAKLAAGDRSVAMVHFTKLRDLGLVVRDASFTGSRGYLGASITEAGRKAVEAFA